MILNNRFQRVCLEKTKTLLKDSLQLEIIFLIEGVSESFYHGKFNIVDIDIDIYIYEDEAGYMLNGKNWKIFEKPDYKSEDNLINAFLESLKTTIDALAKRS